MNIVQLTPGAGAMFCGNCLRDNALVHALRKMGHDVLMVPMYLPLTLDEPDESAGTPIFFSGISVYLQQKSAFFRNTPQWLNNLLASPRLLRWASGRAAKTRAADLGGITLSMLEGELGNQAQELELLINWLKTQPRPDAICLSNALLIGLTRRLKQDLGAPVVCTLQGEDSFLDGLPEPHRRDCWELLSQRAQEIDLFIAPSRYFGELMRKRLQLPPDRVRVVYNGINLAGYPDAPANQTVDSKPTLGYFARMCREKGLDTLVDAFIQIRQRGRVRGLRLLVGGSCGPADQKVVDSMREKLQQAGLSNDAEFFPNLDRPSKIDFLRRLTVFSVPAGYGEAFGLYVIEAMAAGVPVVQPKVAAFPELIEATGGGLLSATPDATGLAEQIEKLSLDPERARALGETGRQTVREKFSVEAMSRAQLAEFETLMHEAVKP